MPKILTFVFLLVTSALYAADYFVDSQTGDDAKSGISTETAWQTLDAVNRAELKPGDTVRFRCGGQWRGQLKPKSGEEGKPVTYTIYGEGEKPRLLSSVPLNRETDWIDEASVIEGVRLWSTQPDTINCGEELPDFVKLKWGVHKEGGASVKLQKISPQEDDDPRLMYQISCGESGSRPNHIQLIVAGFKVEAGKHYLLRFNAKSTKPFTIPSFGFSEPGAPWSGLGVAVQKPDEIGTEWKTQQILFRCDTAHEKARLTLSLGGALPKESEFTFLVRGLYEATVETNGIDSDVGNIILDAHTTTRKAGFKKWTIADLKNPDDFWFDMKTNRIYFVSDENPAKKYKGIEAALHRHVVDHSNCQHVIFDGFDVRYGAAHGFGGTKAKHCVYRNLDISWIGGADQYKGGGEGRRVRFGNGIEFWSDAEDCLVENCRLWEIYDAALTNQGAGVNVERNITYRNNTIWNCEYSFEYWNRGPESVTENVVFENNVCVNAGFGWGHIQRSDKNGRHVMIYSNTAKTKDLIIRNNIFCYSKDSSVRIDADFRDGMSMEGNIYWEEPGDEVFRWLNKNRYNTEQFGRYQEEVGLDKTSKLENPDLSKYPQLPQTIF